MAGTRDIKTVRLIDIQTAADKIIKEYGVDSKMKALLSAQYELLIVNLRLNL